MPLKQRIAFVTNTSWSIYKFRLHLLQALVQNGYEVYVLAPRDKYSSFFENTEGIVYIELKKLKSKSLSVTDDIQLYKELLHHYKQIEPGLIFHYTIKANIYGSLAAARISCPAVAVITGLGYMFSGSKVLRAAASMLYRYALKKTKEVWFLNADDKKVFVEEGLVPAGKTFLLPGEGVDTAVFYAAPFVNRPGPIVFLLIGRLIEHKGIYEFAEAARILHAKKLQVRFNVLGFADDKSAISIPAAQITAWEQDGYIAYLGETDNVVPYIEQADCIVLPSYREGMPLSLLEGASMCKALIASDVAGCREIVKESINGFLCRNKHATDLAAKMEQYYYLPDSAKKEMGMAGREMVIKNFTTDIITGIYLNRLQSLKK